MRQIKEFTKVLLGLLILSTALTAEDIYATFTVEAKKSANLAFSSGGIVASVEVDVNSVVKKGDTLAQLQNDDLKAMLKVAETSLKYAKRDYLRQQKVKKIIDEAQFDKYLFKYENAKAQLLYQQALLDKTILKAPFDGVIFAKDVEAGDAVSAAAVRTVLKIQSPRKRKLLLEVDQKYWKALKVGQKFTYQVDGDPKEYTGTLHKVYAYADSGNRKIKAEVEAEDFVVGLFGDGYIHVSEAK
ncbi:efflux RND transporter periplasmic adaptor subunit [Sulfurovum riftiae]|uniref:Transporter n=1 Tax=Sulfurovum riftiae TaxID=1630136 RepID=A0A151CGR9_9BACT|nr:efflux RND transporter periplasmic adaptor subunit [Sulfurovum riftiae]KYJ86745.1 transporter [Sulfurovum riftiae]